MSGPHVSTPPLLAQSPEMAILDALDTALDIAANALLAANPELDSSEFVCEVPEPAVQACLADAVVVHVTGLQNALDRYRMYVANAEARRPCASQTDIDF